MSLLRCPACREQLRLKTDPEREQVLEDNLICQCGRSYPIHDGVPNLIYPDELLPSDKEYLQQYQKQAEQYDKMIGWLFESFFEDEKTRRAEVIDLLDLKPGDRVLEVSCGTGSNLPYILEHIGSEGQLFALDLSPAMQQVASRKLAGSEASIDFFLANGSYLPFADGSFDALLHLGGVNTFAEIRRALAEMTRVVRVGGKVVIGDEGLAPWLQETEYGQMLLKMNTLYRHQPPLADLPSHVKDVRVSWAIGNAFYFFDYQVGDAAPKLNLDLQVP
ncbi:MAG: class I SAM-dependent methyltransferase [Candidatus Hermodarchaeota archaeon]